MPTNMIETNAHESAQGVNVGKLPEPNVPGDPNRMTMWTRRKFLVGAGAVGTAVISGCAVPGVAIPTAVRMATATPTITPAKIDPEKARATPTPPVLPTAAPTAVPTVAPTPTKASTVEVIVGFPTTEWLVQTPISYGKFNTTIQINVAQDQAAILAQEGIAGRQLNPNNPEAGQTAARNLAAACYLQMCQIKGIVPTLAGFNTFMAKLDQQSVIVPSVDLQTHKKTKETVSLRNIKHVQITMVPTGLSGGNLLTENLSITGNSFGYRWDSTTSTLIFLVPNTKHELADISISDCDIRCSPQLKTNMWTNALATLMLIEDEDMSYKELSSWLDHLINIGHVSDLISHRDGDAWEGIPESNAIKSPGTKYIEFSKRNAPFAWIIK